MQVMVSAILCCKSAVRERVALAEDLQSLHKSITQNRCGLGSRNICSADLLGRRRSIRLLIPIWLGTAIGPWCTLVAIGLRCSKRGPLVLHWRCTIPLLRGWGPAVIEGWWALLVPSTAHTLVETTGWRAKRCTSIPVVGRRVVRHTSLGLA